MSDDKNQNLNQEGAEANLDNFKPQTDDEIRESIIGDLKLNEDDNRDLIDKIANQRIEEQKKLSTAIKQKISYREKLKSTEAKVAGSGSQNENKSTKSNKSSGKSDDEWRKEIEFITINRQFDKDDIGQLKVIARGANQSLEEASGSELFKSYLGAKKQKVDSEKAELGASHRSGSSSNKAPSGDKWRGWAEKRRDQYLGGIRK